MVDFERLEVYQQALGLAEQLYDLTRGFPFQERFGLTDQLRRAAVSVAANIAEGSGRTKRDFRNFLRTARSSAYECVPLLQISSRVGYVQQDRCRHLYGDIVSLSRRLSALMRSLGVDHEP